MRFDVIVWLCDEFSSERIDSKRENVTEKRERERERDLVTCVAKSNDLWKDKVGIQSEFIDDGICTEFE